MGLFGPLIGVVSFVGVVAVLGLGAVWVIRQVDRRETGTDRGPRLAGEPLEIARRRLAAGEITTEEFEDIRDRLRG